MNGVFPSTLSSFIVEVWWAHLYVPFTLRLFSVEAIVVGFTVYGTFQSTLSRVCVEAVSGRVFINHERSYVLTLTCAAQTITDRTWLQEHALPDHHRA